MTQEAIPFDTHRFVRNLMDGGFTQSQAETLAYEQVNMLNTNLSTKSDIEALRQFLQSELEKHRIATQAELEKHRLEIQAEIERVRAEVENLRLATEAKIAEAKSEAIRWAVTAMIAQSAVTITAVVALIKLL
jgi:molecular chaperone GrpE (heat shock protein)